MTMYFEELRIGRVITGHTIIYHQNKLNFYKFSLPFKINIDDTMGNFKCMMLLFRPVQEESLAEMVWYFVLEMVFLFFLILTNGLLSYQRNERFLFVPKCMPWCWEKCRYPTWGNWVMLMVRVVVVGRGRRDCYRGDILSLEFKQNTSRFSMNNIFSPLV